jgi:mono/diheme cytochrome c family protein
MATWKRRAGVTLAGLVVVVALAAGTGFAVSSRHLNARPEVATHALDLSGADVAEGARLAGLFGCRDCHGGNLAGTMLIDAMPVSRIPAPNLTPGREGGALTAEQLERAIRHGVAADGRALFIMPSQEYTYLADREVADLIAYLLTLPAIPDTLPAREFGPVGRGLVAVGKIRSAPERMFADAAHMDAPAKEPTAEYGYYLTRLCIGCHGEDLAGAPSEAPGSPPGANLTPAGNLKNWSYEQFVQTLKTGVTPEGKHLNPMYMPWTALSHANDTELRAIWAYLTSLEPVVRE